jgi:hypothetical protein
VTVVNTTQMGVGRGRIPLETSGLKGLKLLYPFGAQICFAHEHT